MKIATATGTSGSGIAEMNYICALWFWYNGGMEYELFQREVDAAKYAVCMVENEGGTPVGVQFSDGSTLRVEDWLAYKAAENEFMMARQSMLANPQKRESRVIRDPFNNQLVKIDSEKPQWIGKKSEKAE